MSSNQAAPVVIALVLFQPHRSRCPHTPSHTGNTGLLKIHRLHAQNRNRAAPSRHCHIRTTVCFNPVQEPSPSRSASLFSFRHRLIRRAGLLVVLGFDLSGRVMAVRAAQSCNVALGRPFLLHTGTITNYCHTWLDFRHITIAMHQGPSHRALSALAVVGPSSPGRHHLSCTEDELGPWPHHRAVSTQLTCPQDLT